MHEPEYSKDANDKGFNLTEAELQELQEHKEYAENPVIELDKQR